MAIPLPTYKYHGKRINADQLYLISINYFNTNLSKESFRERLRHWQKNFDSVEKAVETPKIEYSLTAKQLQKKALQNNIKISLTTIYRRRQNGWDNDKIVTTPVTVRPGIYYKLDGKKYTTKQLIDIYQSTYKEFVSCTTIQHRAKHAKTLDDVIYPVNHNFARNRSIPYNGHKVTILDLREIALKKYHLNLHERTIKDRLVRLKWSVEKAISTPVLIKRKEK